jgi:hypothetical protein
MRFAFNAGVILADDGHGTTIDWAGAADALLSTTPTAANVKGSVEVARQRRRSWCRLMTFV